MGHELAPVALFVYNRPWHTRQTVEALQQNNPSRETDLFIFSDGPKDKGMKEAVEKVREYIKIIKGFKSINIILRKENFGLAKSIITGVTEIVNKYGKVIVMEDDLVSSSFFLEFMNEALEFYKNEEKVISINAYMYPVKIGSTETFFLKGADCQGWATWKRGWGLFEADGSKLLKELIGKNLQREFNYNNAYKYTKLLKDQITGKNDSWAIRWYASAFLKNKLTLYPARSLLNNIGFDNSGVNSGRSDFFNVTVFDKPIAVRPIDLVEDIKAKKVIEAYFRDIGPCIFSRIKRVLNKIKTEGRFK